jgi:hypothetical protein
MFKVQLFRGKEKAMTGTDRRKGPKGLRRAATVAAAASLVVAAAATPAHAINPPDPFTCVWNTTFGARDYFWLKVPDMRSGTVANLCYVNPGVMAVNIPGVWGYHSGNNTGIMTYNNQFHSFNKWEDTMDYMGTVVSIGIY